MDERLLPRCTRLWSALAGIVAGFVVSIVMLLMCIVMLLMCSIMRLVSLLLGQSEIKWQGKAAYSVENDPGCVKTLLGITAPGILGPAVTRRAKKRKNLSSARRYNQIRFRFHTTKTHSGRCQGYLRRVQPIEPVGAAMAKQQWKQMTLFPSC